VTGTPLTAAFPAELTGDVQAVRPVMPVSRLKPVMPFSVVVQGRLPSPGASTTTSRRQKRWRRSRRVSGGFCTACTPGTGDGMVRQRHLEKVVGSADPWLVPFVVQLVKPRRQC
jgi:hypothetical protein